MKKRTAVLFVVAGMMLNACNPLETSKPIETTAATVTEAVTTTDTVAFETEAVVADSDVSKGMVGKKKGETNPLRPSIEVEKLRPKAEMNAGKEELPADGYQSLLDVMAVPLTDPPEGLYHYESTCFYYNDEEWFLDVYTSAAPDGEYYAYDDQNRFFVRARYGEYQFNIFDDWVQLGFPEIDIIDEGKTLHIVMTDIRTASYTVTDYSFMEDDFYFQENTLIDLQGINYIGDLDVN